MGQGGKRLHKSGAMNDNIGLTCGGKLEKVAAVVDNGAPVPGLVKVAWEGKRACWKEGEDESVGRGTLT